MKRKGRVSESVSNARENEKVGERKKVELTTSLFLDFFSFLAFFSPSTGAGESTAKKRSQKESETTSDEGVSFPQSREEGKLQHGS